MKDRGKIKIQKSCTYQQYNQQKKKRSMRMYLNVNTPVGMAV